MPETLTAPTGFDVDAARREGYSDDDILTHLTTSRKFDIAGALKEGYTKQDIIQHLSSTAPAAAPTHKFTPGGGESRGPAIGNRSGGVTAPFTLPGDMDPKEKLRQAALTPAQYFNENLYGTEYKLGTAGLNAIKGARNLLYKLGNTPTLLGTVEAPGIVKDVVSSTAHGVASTPQTFEDFYQGLKTGDMGKTQDAAVKFASENAPAILGLEGGVKAGAEAGFGAADSFAASRALKAQNTSYDALSTAIQSGIKKGTGFEAAGVYQPYIQSFLKKAGVNPADILPKSGDSATLIRGGSTEALTRLNKALQADWVASGRPAARFVPQTDIHMALAEGAVNEAHAPIANAIRAVQGVKIDGSEINVPNVQAKVISALESRKAALSPSQHAELDLNFDRAIADVRSRGGTIGGLNSIRQDWNSGMSRFHSGNPSAVTNADASSAAVWNDGNNIIRQNLYPAVQDLVDRPGAETGLAEAGRRESVAIQARDGIYNERVRSANANSNASIQSYLDYVREGPHLAANAVRNPVMTGVGLGSRLLGRQKPMGEFNAALRKGIGNISDYSRMDASAFPKKQITAGDPFANSGPTPIKIQDVVAYDNVRKLLPSGPPVLPEEGYVPGQGGVAEPPTPPYIHPGTANPGYPTGTGPASGYAPPKVEGLASDHLTRTSSPEEVAAPTPPPHHLGVEIGKQAGAAPPKNVQAGAPYQLEPPAETPEVKPPTPPPTGLPEGKGQAKTSAPAPSTKTVSEHVGTAEKPVEKVSSGYPEGNKEQSGRPAPRTTEYPESAKDYFTALEEDAAAEEAAPEKPETKKTAPAAEKKAAPAAKKAAPTKTAPAPKSPPKAAKTPAKTETEAPVSPPKVTFDKKAAAPKPRPAPTKVDRIIAPAGIKAMEEKASILDKQIQNETSAAAIKDLESRIKQIKSEIDAAKKRLEDQDITPAQRNIELRNQPLRTKNLQLLVHLRSQIK